MNQVFQSAFAEALGWSLIDSLWQFGAIWLSYVALTSNGKKYSANTRHLLALSGTAAGTMLFFFTILFNYYFPESHASAFISQFATELNIVPYLSIIYIPAVLFFGMRLFYRALSDRKSYKRNLASAPESINEFVSKMTGRFSIVRKVSVWVSETTISPLTLGFWKPVIILPMAMFNQLTPSQVEAVLTHELYHIKRNDYLLNIFLTLSEVILFFNPFAKLMCGIVKKERENSCDDKVVASGFDAWQYSQALYVLGRNTFQQSLALAATGPRKEYLLQRIKRMVSSSTTTPSIIKPFLAFFLCLVVAGIIARNHHQPPVVASKVPEAVATTVAYRTTATKETRPAPTKTRGTVKRKAKTSEPATSITQVPAPAPPPPSPMPEEPDDVLISYVAAPETIEFTMIDQAEPDVPEVVVTEKPQPFVPASSFYFTEIDTTGGKKIIRL